MIANYHTHTPRCHHAAGSEREYIENAIENGIRILGFSDHAPMPYPDGYVSAVRMAVNELDDYVDTLLALRNEYRNDITLHIGLEAEYFPAVFDAFLDLISQYPVEYLIMGQHALVDERYEVYAGSRTSDPDRLVTYVDQVIKGLETGCFTYLAHPDLLWFTGERAVYEKQMQRLCERAKTLDIPLEVNFLGISGKRNYPEPLFWKIAGETGNTAVFGSDAHTPEMVYNPAAETAALRLMNESGISTILQTVENRLACLPKHAEKV